MKSRQDIEQFVKNAGIRSDPNVNQAVLKDLLKQIDDAETQKPAVTLPNIRRTIMRSPITKLAAAAVIVIAVGFGVLYLTELGTTPVYAITDMPELLRTTRTLHLKGWLYHPGCKTPDGNDVLPVNWEQWYDLENGREWSTTSSASGRADSTKITLGELISDQQYQLRLNHTKRWAYFSRQNKYNQMLEQRRNKNDAAALIFGDISKLGDYIKIGGEKVDGVDCDIWEREEIFSATEGASRYRYWLSPATGECKRSQFWMRFRNNQAWQLCYEYYKIERNVDIPEGTFAMEIPEGYEARNTKETATVLPLGSPKAAVGFGVGYGVALSFTMSDGSVIWGWNSFDQESEKKQEDFFEGLEFGGALPKLPIEFNILKPAGEPKEMTYTGYHLAYTRKADRFTEWALYIPNGTPPKNVKEFGYHALYVFNLERKPRLETNVGVPYGLLIETKGDFDKWVLGAMAELSDNGKSPDNVTYENVLQLTKRLRESMSQ
jgi:hypothetical protein